VEEIASGSRPPDETEAEAAQGCLDLYGNSAEVPSSGILGVEGITFLNNLTPDQWDALIVHLLPSNELQTMTESTLDEIIAYFKGETDAVQMPLVNLKARLTGKAGAELTLLLLESQPPCTREQQAQIIVGDFGDEGTAPIFCSTTGETQVLLSTELQRRLKNVATEIPDHAVLIKPPSPSIPSRFQILLGKDRQSALQRINAGIPYSPLLPLALLLLIALFAVRSLRGWLRWWGIPVFIASIITLTIAIFSFFMFDWIWVKTILPDIPPSLTSGFGEISHDVAHSLVSDLAPWVMLGAGIVALPALGMIVASFHVAPPPDPSLPPLALPGTPGGPVVSQSKSKRRRKGW
jgi:hypothetical protein